MKYVAVTQPGGPEVLALREREQPKIAADEVLIRVAAAGVNRPDVQQRRGLYPPPLGACDTLGLDVAGVVETAGASVKWPVRGERVCALVNGGGYAEFCAVPAVQCMPLPDGFGFVQAAALPEALFTAWNNVIRLGRLAAGETLLVQGGTSGVGMAAIQLACLLRSACVLATVGTEQKARVARDIGASAAVLYTRADWPQQIRALTGGRGVDVILDAQAGPYTQKELDLLAPDGRLVLIASHLGAAAEVDVRDLVRRRLTLTGSTLRPRSPEYKGGIARELVAEVWSLLSRGAFKVNICATFPIEEVASAHALLDANQQVGKVVLIVAAELCDSQP